MTIPFWSPEKIATASEMWKSGHSVGQIAKHFGVARGSVASITNRYRAMFPMRKEINRLMNRRQPSPKSRPTAIFDELCHAPKPDATGVRYNHRDRSIAGAPAISFHELGPGECRWPLTNFDDRGGYDMPCCGRPTAQGYWCCEHAQMATGAGTHSERVAHRDLEKIGRAA